MPEELIELIPNDDICTWSNDPDEKRRAFIVHEYAVAEVEGDILIKNMEMIFHWLKTGKMPEKEKAKLRAVL